MTKMVSRDSCISCGSAELKRLGGGFYGEDPLRSFIASDPWGEDPLPHLQGEVWELVQCGDCAQKFHRYILSPEWNEIRFSQWMSEDAIRQFEEAHGGTKNRAAEHVQHVLRLRDLGVRRVLDFGCGFARFLQMCSLFGLDAVGVDRSIGRRSGAGVEVFPELDDAQGEFDAITMFEVLEHLDDPLATLGALRDRLKPGGVIVIEVPDTSGVDGIQSRDDYYKIHPLDHINAFTPETLVGIMERAGFHEIPKKPAFVTTSLKRVAKDIAKAKLKPAATQRYFRRD